MKIKIETGIPIVSTRGRGSKIGILNEEILHAFYSGKIQKGDSFLCPHDCSMLINRLTDNGIYISRRYIAESECYRIWRVL
jgi:hypothetical protein